MKQALKIKSHTLAEQMFASCYDTGGVVESYNKINHNGMNQILGRGARSKQIGQSPSSSSKSQPVASAFMRSIVFSRNLRNPLDNKKRLKGSLVLT
jgi:hypothetical protein